MKPLKTDTAGGHTKSNSEPHPLTCAESVTFRASQYGLAIGRRSGATAGGRGRRTAVVGQRSPVHIHCPIAFESSRIARFIMDIEKQVERSSTENICINWVVTWPWKQGHSSTIQDHRNVPLADIVQKSQKVSYAKIRPLRKNCDVRPRKKLSGAVPPSPQVQARVKDVRRKTTLWRDPNVGLHDQNFEGS